MSGDTRFARTLVLCGAIALAGAARAEDPPAPSDSDALQLADSAPDVRADPSEWRAFLETGAVRDLGRLGFPDQSGGRLSGDVHLDHALEAGLHVVFSDRLDVEEAGPPETRTTLNTLKEAYLSWHASAEEIVDVGRVNLRYGVATGYNPTDFFRADAIRSIVSLDPSSLRENRLGTVVVQSQTLWEGSSVSALISPKLADQGRSAPFSADWGATNATDRWLISGSHQFTENLNPQLVVFGQEHQSPHWGGNVSALFGQATLFYLEAETGPGTSLLAQSLGRPTPEEREDEAAAGLSYTTADNLTLTLEGEFSGAGLDSGEARTFARLPLLARLDYLQTVQNLQELPVRRAVFASALWQDAFIQHLDLQAFARIDVIGHSRLFWTEARYHFTKADVAFQVSDYSGAPDTVFGSVPSRRTFQLLLRYFI